MSQILDLVAYKRGLEDGTECRCFEPPFGKGAQWECYEAGYYRGFQKMMDARKTAAEQRELIE